MIKDLVTIYGSSISYFTIKIENYPFGQEEKCLE